MNTIRRVAIVGGNRIPFVRSNTAYARASNQDMLTAALQGLVDRFDLHGVRLGEVSGGAVMKHARDFNLVRESVLGTTLSPQTPAYDVQQACGTSLEATLLVANKIALGHIECGDGRWRGHHLGCAHCPQRALASIAAGVEPLAFRFEAAGRGVALAPWSCSSSLRCPAMSNPARVGPWVNMPRRWLKPGGFAVKSKTPGRSRVISTWHRLTSAASSTT